MENTRRKFLVSTSSLLVATSLISIGYTEKKEEESEGEVGATEDLMREHGVLNRALLIYEEGLRRLRAKEEVKPTAFNHTALLIRKFVEDYHERLEENFIFPEFEKRGQLVGLVKTLRVQHQAGRTLTETVIHHSASEKHFYQADNQARLVKTVEAFIRMYRPHEAREDTILFPTFRKIVTPKQLKELGEQFEKEEDQLFGDEGFEKTVDQVATMEKELGIYDLEKFTPEIP